MFILETERLTLRHLLPEDLDALATLYRDAHVRRYFPEGTLSLAQTREELEWFLHGHPRHPGLGLWATVDRHTGAFIGRCGLLPWHIDGSDEVELAYLIDKRRWSQGLASEAAAAIVRYAGQTLQLNRLICLIMPGNVPSARVAQKIGMRLEREYTDQFGPCHLYARSLERNTV
jgi:ribosomal-protein-alanine N-acetyltransferase